MLGRGDRNQDIRQGGKSIPLCDIWHDETRLLDRSEVVSRGRYSRPALIQMSLIEFMFSSLYGIVSYPWENDDSWNPLRTNKLRTQRVWAGSLRFHRAFKCVWTLRTEPEN